HDRRSVELVGAVGRLERRAPAGGRLREARQAVMREDGRGSRLEALAERLRDRMAGPVTDLQEPLARGAAAAGEPVAPVLAGEPAAELLEPGDRAGCFGREHLDEL